MPCGCADYTVIDQLTRAAISQAEGAIEGRAAQYEMPSPHATNFAFSRFEGARQYGNMYPLSLPLADMEASATERSD